MDEFTAALARANAWIDAHPWGWACLFGWIAALAAAQTIKQLLPPTWSVTDVKRISQAIALLAGSLVSYVLWPATGAHSVVYAIVVGMSAPTAYTLLKALIEWRFPGLAHALSWESVQERKGGPSSPDDTCAPHA